MTIAYIDGASGASGDMLLGALLDCGWPASELEAILRTVFPGPWQLSSHVVSVHGLRATRLQFLFPHEQPLRHLDDLFALLDHAPLPPPVRSQSRLVLQQLGSAEATIHGVPLDAVHFHELGAADTLCDIVGFCAGLHALNITEILVAPLNLGNGYIHITHGLVPVPPPAVRELTRDLITYGSPEPVGELLTPTAAALLSTLGRAVLAQPMLTHTRTGFGAGTKELPWPNIIRLTLGESPTEINSPTPLQLLSCNIDDMQPELYSTLFDHLLTAGALDVWLTPIVMKKQRPAITLSVLSTSELSPTLQHLIFIHTTTLGIRIQTLSRTTLQRRWQTVATSYGNIRLKIGILQGRIVNIAPEYDDCAQCAKEHHVPEKIVYQAALRAYNPEPDLSLAENE